MKNRIIITLAGVILLSLSAGFVQAQNRPADKRAERAERERLQRIMAPSADIEEFRREYEGFLAELEESAGRVFSSRFAQQVLAHSGMNPLEQIGWARRQLPQLKEQELVGLRSAFARSAEWREIPQRLESLVRPEVQGMMQTLAPSDAGLTPDKCSDAFKNGDVNGDARVSNTDISISAAFVLAADTIVDSLPDDFLSFAGKAVAAVVRGGLQGALLVLETFKSISDDCSGGKFEGEVKTKLDTANTSIDTAIKNVAGVKTDVGKVQTTVNTLAKTAGDTQTAVNTILSRVDTTISSRANQTSVNTLQSTANLINGKADMALVKLDSTLAKLDTTLAKLDALAAQVKSLQEENLRLQVELNLLQGPRYNHVQMQTPEAQGGHLELVAKIVRTTIDTSRNANLTASPGAITQAEEWMTTAKIYYDVRAYKDAYAAYRTAYLLLSVMPGTRQP